MDDASFLEYFGSRLEPLRRTAYLMCGDWFQADDAVSAAVAKIYRGWGRISRMDNLDAYVRRAVLNAWLSERARPWRRETPMSEPPPTPEPPDGRVHDRLTLLKHLQALPAGRRAVIVLRYYCDLSVEETAAALGCSVGTVKSQTARALDTLRASLVNVPDLAKE